MNKENTLKLFNDFPKLYSGRYDPINQNLMGFGFECEDGWVDILYNLSKKITEIYPEVKATQVKEKFGTLRFYIEGAPQEVYDEIDKAEILSSKICELCGKAGSMHHRGTWLKALCTECAVNEEYEKCEGEYYDD